MAWLSLWLGSSGFGVGLPSLLPIKPAGKPTLKPLASISQLKPDSFRPRITGVLAFVIALPGPGGATPQPSMQIRQTLWSVMSIAIM